MSCGDTHPRIVAANMTIKNDCGGGLACSPVKLWPEKVFITSTLFIFECQSEVALLTEHLLRNYLSLACHNLERLYEECISCYRHNIGVPHTDRHALVYALHLYNDTTTTIAISVCLSVSLSCRNDEPAIHETPHRRHCDDSQPPECVQVYPHSCTVGINKSKTGMDCVTETGMDCCCCWASMECATVHSCYIFGNCTSECVTQGVAVHWQHFCFCK